jgi:hypothetical protein
MRRYPPPLKFEEAITLSEAARLLPGRPAAGTVWRWARKGLRGVRLGYVRRGRKILTSRAEVERFMSRLARRDNEHLTQRPQRDHHHEGRVCK